MPTATDRRDFVLKLLTKQHSASTATIAWRLMQAGLTKRGCHSKQDNGCLAASAVLNAMDRADLVVTYPSNPKCRWSVRLWSLTEAGRQLAKQV